jgi:rhomboid family GlyGly-CTERM serine protease
VNADRILQRAGVTEQRLRDWSPVLAMLAICLALAIGGDDLRTLGRYERTAIEDGEYWRLLSGHFVHLGWAHLWPNLAALLIIGALFQDILRGSDWLLAALVSASAIDAGLYVLDPELQWYVGLSGVLHGFVAAGALEAMLRRQTFGLVLAIGLCVKLIFEHIVGPMPFSAANVGGPVIVAAHLYGTAGGLAFATVNHFVRRRGSRV